MKNRVCAIIVTYNRRDLLLRNIEHINQQSVPCDILIYDNCSTDMTEQFLDDKGILALENVDYHYADLNTGGAGGFAHGIQMAYDKGYEYLWLMDDDGYPINSVTLQILLDRFEAVVNKKIILNSLVLCQPTEQGGHDELSFTLYNERYLNKISERVRNGVVEGEISSFNSTFFHRDLVGEIGVPREEFFIYGDDTDYLKRAELAGYQVVTVVDSRYYHPDSYMGYYRVGNRMISMRPMSLWNTYYYVRNYMYIVKIYAGKRKAIKHGFWVLGKTLLYKDRKWKRLWVSCQALIAGYREDFSKNQNTCDIMM